MGKIRPVFCYLFVGFFSLLFHLHPIEAQILVRGKLLQANQPLADTRIVIEGVNTPTFTNQQGDFSVTISNDGYYSIRIYAPSGLQVVRREIRQGIYLNINIQTSQNQIQTASPESGFFVQGNRDRTRLSRYTLTKEELRRFPGAYGDSLKAVQSLPGVSPATPVGVAPTANLGAQLKMAGISIGPPYSNSTNGPVVLRGSGARASKFFLDGFLLPYPFHLGDQASVVNNDFINGVDVYTGIFPARYGLATGGIVALRGPDAESITKPAGHFNLAFFLSDAHYEAPLYTSDDTKIYFVGTVRKSYPNYMLLHTAPQTIPPNAKFADYADSQWKVGVKTKSHEVSVLYAGAYDRLNYTQTVANSTNQRENAILSLLNPGADLANYNSNTDNRPPVGVSRQFHTGGFRWQFDVGRFSQTLQGQVNRFKEQFELDFRSPFTGETMFKFEILDHRNDKDGFYEAEVELIRNHVLIRAGAQYREYNWELSMHNLTESSTVNPNTPKFMDTINRLIDENRTFRSLYDGDRTFYFTASTFFEAEILWAGFRLTPGIRSDYYSLSKDRGAGPRIGVEYFFESTGTRLLASGSKHFAPPSGLEQISNESGNPFLKMEEADHWAGGIEQQIGRSLLVRIEGFRNRFRHLAVEDEWNHKPFSPRDNKRDLVEKTESIIKTPIETRPLFYSDVGDGESHGVELFIAKKTETNYGLSGWISVTASWSKRNNHQPRLTGDERTDFNKRTFRKELSFYHRFGPLQYLEYDDGHQEWLYDNDRAELYDLDRTYQASVVIRYSFNSTWRIGAHWKYADNLPITPIENHQKITVGPISTYLPEYSKAYNSARYTAVHQLNLRLDHFNNYEWGYGNWFIEFMNVYGRQNVEKENFNFMYPYYRGFNPEPQFESTYLQSGKKRIPIINAGLEIRF